MEASFDLDFLLITVPVQYKGCIQLLFLLLLLLLTSSLLAYVIIIFIIYAYIIATDIEIFII